MTYASVKTALTPILAAAIPGVTVADRNQFDRLLPSPSLMPLVMLRDRPHGETPLAIGAADRVWWLECMLWNTYVSDSDQSSFDQLREQLQYALRTSTLMGGNADDLTFGTKLYVSGRQLEVHDYPAVSVSGQIYRHCLVSTLVREVAFFAAV